MSPFLKKTSLLYLLFLFSTLSGSPTHTADTLATEGDLAFQEMKEQIEQDSLFEEKLFEEKRLKKASQDASPSNEELKVEEPPLGVTPALIEIPAIDARAEVIQVGQTATGNMEAPENIHTIGWYEPGIKPGNKGNAVLAGHVDGLTGPGTFYNLKKLEKGNKIRITGTDGKELIFIVKEKQSYLPKDAPLDEIFGASSEENLNLITCTGIFNTAVGHYEERLVIYAELMKN